MKNIFSAKIFFLILALLVLTSCKSLFYKDALYSKKILTYEGPPLPRSEVGILTCKGGLYVEEIDDRTIKEILDTVGFDDTQYEYQSFELLPGEHIIKVASVRTSGPDFPMGSKKEVWFLKFLVKPGQDYIIDTARGKRIKGKTGNVYNLISSVVIKNKASKRIISEIVEEKK